MGRSEAHKIRNHAKRLKPHLYARYNARCYLCGKYLMYHQATLDHVVAIRDGGANGYKGNNLAIACADCNGKKDAEKSVNEMCSMCKMEKRAPRSRRCSHCQVTGGTFIRFASLGDSREVWGLDLFDIRKERRERDRREMS